MRVGVHPIAVGMFGAVVHPLGIARDHLFEEALDVGESTFYVWCNKYPEFRESVRLGKDAADDRVERTLYRRAVGYSFDAIKIMQYEGQVVIEPYVEHVPPDVGAAKLWLTNRRGKDWREKQEHEHSGSFVLHIDSDDAKA